MRKIYIFSKFSYILQLYKKTYKKLYENVGGYDPKFSVSQDYIFMRSVIKNNFRIKYLKNVLYKSRDLSNSVSRKNRSFQKKLPNVINNEK